MVQLLRSSKRCPECNCAIQWRPTAAFRLNYGLMTAQELLRRERERCRHHEVLQQIQASRANAQRGLTSIRAHSLLSRNTNTTTVATQTSSMDVRVGHKMLSYTL